MRFLTTALLACFLAATPVTAQQTKISIPLDFTSGLTFGQGDPTPWEGSFRAAGLWRFGELGAVRAGIAASALYRNPDWDPGIGVRIEGRVISLLRDAGMYLVGEALYWENRVPLSVGSVFLLPVSKMKSPRVGLWLTWDAELERWSFSVLLGTDLYSWFKPAPEDYEPFE